MAEGKRPTASQVIRSLGLEALHGEGGWFRRTWSSPVELGPGRPAGSAIYYLLTSQPDGFSALHVLKTDEVYHFYAGDPVELHRIDDSGRDDMVRLGPDFTGGDQVQAVVTALTLQGSRLAAGGQWALLGTTMAPAFTEGDFMLPSRAELVARFPQLAGLILGLSRE